MPRISMKLTASLVGTLALLLAAACERSTETTPEPAPGSTSVAQEPNSLRPTPSSAATPGNASPSGNRATPSAAAPMEDPDTVPVRGTDPDMQGGGGHSGHGGQGGHSGHGGKTGH